jgi:DNA-binding NarL/FixJ family response regulator
MTKITVLLADDHTLVREGLRAILELADDFNVVGEAANGLEAVEMAGTLCPAVVVLDIAMPRLNGIEAARRIIQQSAIPPKVLILSAYADDTHIKDVISLGVSGYLIKQTSARILAQTIREIHAGKTVYSPSIAERMDDRPAPRSQNCRDKKGKVDKTGIARLTPREREVFQWIAEGNINKEVADRLGISIKTVEKHRQNVMHKLGLHDTSSLTRYAFSLGIVESGPRRSHL